MGGPLNAAELDKRLRVLRPDPDAAPKGSPYAPPDDIEPFDIPIPAGHTEPADAEAALDAWLATPNVRLLDHIVVTQTETVSMAARGLI